MKSTKRHDRASALYRLLTSKRQAGYSLDELCGQLQCSESTAKRLIRDLRNEYNHPIEFDQERGGYFYNREQQAVGSFEMPGLWFMETELWALLTMQHLLGSIDSGRLAEEIAPFGAKIEQILATTAVEPGDVARPHPRSASSSPILIQTTSGCCRRSRRLCPSTTDSGLSRVRVSSVREPRRARRGHYSFAVIDRQLRTLQDYGHACAPC